MNLYGVVNDTKKVKWAFLSDTLDEKELEYVTGNLCSESFKAFINMLFPRIKSKLYSTIPMLVICAEKDNIFSVKESKRTAKKLNADLIILSYIAHDMMLDKY